MRPVVRPEAPTLSVDRRTVDGTCAECGASQLAEYPAISEGGWWTVVKCQSCLHSASRVRAPLFGSLETMTSLLNSMAGLDV
jgi:hypothetical protein